MTFSKSQHRGAHPDPSEQRQDGPSSRKGERDRKQRREQGDGPSPRQTRRAVRRALREEKHDKRDDDSKDQPSPAPWSRSGGGFGHEDAYLYMDFLAPLGRKPLLAANFIKERCEGFSR